MRRRNFSQPGSRSVGCPPGCRLPCCSPGRRRPPKPNRCVFIPPPARTTKRYCGDPCSPPPPGCTPRPVFSRARKSRAALRCDPCETRSRPLSTCSPRAYSRPFRPFSSLYSSTNPCRPKSCGPLDPCVPSITDRCDPCGPQMLRDPCCRTMSRFSSPRCFNGNKCMTPCRKPRKSRCSASPKRRRRRCSRRSSSCGSSYCESSYSRTGRCPVCDCDPCCCCNNCDDRGHEEKVKCATNNDTSKGPTTWFLKKSEKCAKNKSSKDPHFCPWEAEVKVTGTVRGHCTSTAVEVAKRLTGKFSSKGQRYTTCKKDANRCEPTKGKCKPQKMALGYLDDGTKLDFSRNRCEDGDESDFQSDELFLKGRTNNAISDTAVVANRWRSRWDDVRARETKHSGREDLSFATAYIGANNDESAGGYVNNIEDDPQHGVYTLPSRRSRGSRYSQARGQVYSVASDSDQSSYRTASESVQREVWHTSGRRYQSSSRDAEDNITHVRRKRHMEDFDLHTDTNRFPNNSSSGVGRREEWWQRHNNYPRTSVDDNCYDGEDDENGHINFNPVSDDDDDDDDYDDNRDDNGCVNGDNVSDNDDIDEVDPHFTSLPRRLAVDGHVRSSDRRYTSPVSYSRRSAYDSPAQHRNRHQSRASGATRQSLLDSPYLHPDVSYSGQFSDGELGEGRYSNTHNERHRWDMGHRSKHLNHRKRVTYGEGL